MLIKRMITEEAGPVPYWAQFTEIKRKEKEK
jgi:hypothetical protein